MQKGPAGATLLPASVELSEWHDPVFDRNQLRVRVLRLDQIDRYSGGNKIFKLAGNLEAFYQSQAGGIVSFGGPWSNHLVALAALTDQHSIPCLGLIRGEGHTWLSPALEFCISRGMRLSFVSKSDYRRFCESGQPLPEAWLHEFPTPFIIPEGGSSAYGVKGAAAIASYLPPETDAVWLALGTGASLAGLSLALSNTPVKLTGVAVSADTVYTTERITAYLQNEGRAAYAINDRFHFGGYARSTTELDHFIQQINATQAFRLEPVYTGKLFYAFYQAVLNRELKAQQQVVLIHTGGLAFATS